MKTKEDVKKARGQEIDELRGVKQEPTETPNRSRDAATRFSTPRPLDSSTPLSVEQSENVYENKGQVQNVW